MLFSDAEVKMVRGCQLLKVQPHMVARAVVESERPELLVTHWFGRQFVCPGLDCPACGTYQSRLTVFNLVTVVLDGKRSPRLLELSAQSWARLRFMLQWDEDRAVAGVEVTLRRAGMRSPVIAEPTGQFCDVRADLFSANVLLDAVGLVLKLPPRRSDECGRSWADRIRGFCVRRLEEAIQKAG